MATQELTVIIIGAGEVGKGLAHRLISEGHNVKIIDTNSAVLADMESHLDVMGVEGNGASVSVLLKAGVKETDLIIGVSDNDECNLIACAAAKQFNVKTALARVRSEDYIIPDRSHYAKAMKIDLIINPDEVASLELYDILENPVASSVADFANGRLKLLGMRVQEDAPIANRKLKELPELASQGSLLITSLVRNHEFIIPRGETKVLPGDEVYVISTPSSLSVVNEIGGIANSSLKKVVLVGASRVSFFVAERLEKSGTHVVLIEQDEKKCEIFASELEHTTVLLGDGTDLNILAEAGVNEADGFVSASQDDETNVLSALLAKESGAKRVIALLRKPQYMPLLAHIKPIDVAINPRLSTINAIMRYVRQGKTLSMATMAEDRAEAIEIEILDTSPLIGRPLKENFLPRNVLLGAIVRNDEIIIPSGEDALQADDRAILIALKDAVTKVDELFSQDRRSSSIKRIIASVSEAMSFRNIDQPHE